MKKKYPIKRFPFTPFFWEDEWDISLDEEPSGLSISEDEENIYVEAALPGIKKEEIEITLDKGIVWIKGERKEEETKKKYYKKASKHYSYRVSLPVEIDEKKEAEATYENGVMTIIFPKKKGYEPKKIRIKNL